MKKCGYCGSTVIIGGVNAGGERFCNNKCASGGAILRLAQQVPPEVVDRQVEEVFHSNCPQCGGVGPVDVYKVHRVWSALVLTRWTTTTRICCRSCATKSQSGGAVFSLIFGWWGFPWGLVLTPVQIIRNILGIWCRADSSRPSEDLRRVVLVELGRKHLPQAQQQLAPVGYRT